MVPAHTLHRLDATGGTQVAALVHVHRAFVISHWFPTIVLMAACHDGIAAVVGECFTRVAFKLRVADTTVVLMLAHGQPHHVGYITQLFWQLTQSVHLQHALLVCQVSACPSYD